MPRVRWPATGEPMRGLAKATSRMKPKYTASMAAVSQRATRHRRAARRPISGLGMDAGILPLTSGFETGAHPGDGGAGRGLAVHHRLVVLLLVGEEEHGRGGAGDLHEREQLGDF